MIYRFSFDQKIIKANKIPNTPVTTCRSYDMLELRHVGIPLVENPPHFPPPPPQARHWSRVHCHQGAGYWDMSRSLHSLSVLVSQHFAFWAECFICCLQKIYILGRVISWNIIPIFRFKSILWLAELTM